MCLLLVVVLCRVSYCCLVCLSLLVVRVCCSLV